MASTAQEAGLGREKVGLVYDSTTTPAQEVTGRGFQRAWVGMRERVRYAARIAAIPLTFGGGVSLTYALTEKVNELVAYGIHPIAENVMPVAGAGALVTTVAVGLQIAAFVEGNYHRH